MLNTWN